MAKKSKKAYEGIDLSSSGLDDILDSIEKDVDIGWSDPASKVPLSTGLLSLDLALSGGLMSGGWYTFFGGEQSSKSTLAQTQLARALVTGYVPILLYFDFEGSFSPDYFLNIAKGQGLDSKLKIQDIFGVQDPKTGKYIKKPMIRRYQENVAEKFFDYVYKLERMLPDKLFKKDQWWNVYDDNKANSKYKSKADTGLYKKTGKLWVPAENGYPQALIVVDSYPAMLPAKMDEEDASSGLSAQARMFSEQLKRVKGRMSNKRIIIMGINQLRLKPMSMGNPEYEPGGEALKFFSDARLRMASRSSVFDAKGPVLEEPSVTGKGKDIYRYVHFRAHKNKLSTPNLEGWLRVWVRDAKGNAWGYDPVFDTFIFMKSLGFVSGTKNKIKISIPGMEGHKPMTWLDFKTLIIGSKADKDSVFKSIGIKKPIKIREKLFKYMESGKATERYFKVMAEGAKDESDDE